MATFFEFRIKVYDTGDFDGFTKKQAFDLLSRIINVGQAEAQHIPSDWDTDEEANALAHSVITIEEIE